MNGVEILLFGVFFPVSVGVSRFFMNHYCFPADPCVIADGRKALLNRGHLIL